MRGRGFEYVKQYGEAGITPAYAGKRIYICRNPDCGRDHPRVCGEEFRVRQLYCLHVGSPPRMRGRVWAAAAACAVAGITPAYAGKRCCQRLLCPVLRDHPRVCGEERPVRRGACSGLGSPPRMRGRDPSPSQMTADVGITPAYAGKRADSL